MASFPSRVAALLLACSALAPHEIIIADAAFLPASVASTKHHILDKRPIVTLHGSNSDDKITKDSAEVDRSTLTSGYTSEGYSATVTRGEGWFKNVIEPGRVWMHHQREREKTKDEYSSSMGMRRAGKVARVLTAPFRLASRATLRREPGNLILVRHGESVWYKNQTFTGWADPDLSEQGYREVEHAARLLREAGYDIDVVFTSRLKRAIHSAWAIVNELDEAYLPVFKTWRLNERCYGAVTGMCKADLAEKMGPYLIQKWRNDIYSVPPAMTTSDPRWPGRDRKFADLTNEQIPLTESLADCMKRTVPLWEDKIKSELEAGHNVLVVAHDTSLRGLIKQVENVGDVQVQGLRIPRGSPIVYQFDMSMKPLKPTEDQVCFQEHLSGTFLEKPGLLQEAFKREEDWRKNVPGYSSTLAKPNKDISSLERSLSKLQAERELEDWVDEFFDDEDDDEEDYDVSEISAEISSYLKSLENTANGDPESTMTETVKYNPSPIVIRSHPCLQGLPAGTELPDIKLPARQGAVIVMIRHGKTGHNKLGLFTGWEDAPLAPEGVEEAKVAGRLLKKHGFEFDVVYTSWLSRAIETAWHVMDQLDSTWLPVIKSWRLNERMYGDLTGKSKKMIARIHGEKQFKKWRRGYKNRPPPVSSFSLDYPGNDKRYQKFLNDLPISVSESIIRSIEKRKPTLSRNFPKTEALRDCMKRTIPYFKYNIMPDAVEKGKRVLIASSENAIRGLLMYLCDIPEDKIAQLSIPNGIPLIFDIKSKCVKLLDDGTGRDPLEVYEFGSGAEYLFNCDEDAPADEECPIDMLADEAYDVLKDYIKVSSTDKAANLTVVS